MTVGAPRLLDDCFLHDKDRLRHDDALALLRGRISPIAAAESIGIADALGRILAEDITAPQDVPAYDNAAVDGYAFDHENLISGAASTLPVTLRVTAGPHDPGTLKPGAAARIFTGAPMPAGADSVVMQEDVTTSEQGGTPHVTVPDGLKAGANRRRAGEDVAKGAAVVVTGARLRPQEIAAIASIGRDRIACFQPLKVALISTGDEVVRPGTQLGEGQLYDSNHFLLRACLDIVGARITDLGILADDETVVRDALVQAAESHDVILSTGGASRGEEDHVVHVLQEIGALHAWQIAIKPGRPLAFGQIGQTVFLGLPGNPVAVMVCFLLYGLPVLTRLQGARWPSPVRYRIAAGFSIERKKPDRREFLRGILRHTGDGLVVDKFQRDGSALISSLTAADGLIELAEDVTALQQGELVDFIPFAGFGLPPR